MPASVRSAQSRPSSRVGARVSVTATGAAGSCPTDPESPQPASKNPASAKPRRARARHACKGGHEEVASRSRLNGHRGWITLRVTPQSAGASAGGPAAVV